MMLPADLRVNDEKASAFKRIEDRTDAVMCAYIAALAWLGKVECVGTLAGGYIVLPKAFDPAVSDLTCAPRETSALR